MELEQRLADVRADLAAHCVRADRPIGDVQLLAVSKRHPVEALRAALALGQRDLGESRVQELQSKAEAMGGTGVRWHMIGSVQTNKVRDLLAVEGLVLLHSLDRPKLAKVLEAELSAHGAERTLDVLVQINATGEAQKQGVAPEDAAAFMADLRDHHPHLRVQGLMAMGPLQGDAAPVFARVRELRDELAAEQAVALPILSLGMTGDMGAAIAAGSTMVRVGTGVFGARP